MSKKSEQTFTPEDFQQRFEAAALAAQREYCDIFGLWRLCLSPGQSLRRRRATLPAPRLRAGAG